MFGALLFYAFCLSFILMLIVWMISVRIKNAGVVDIAWAANFSLLALVFAGLGNGAVTRKGLIAFMVLFWSLRLAAHLYVRVMGHHPVEDTRYQALRKEWAPNINLKFFLFFEAQALLNVALSVPFLLASLNPEPQIRWIEWIGLAVWMMAFIGESVADAQLKKFKSDPANKGKTCQAGLWYFSRHPNYFFEWLNWIAYFLFALGSPHGWTSVYCPLLMLYFLLKVTGVPMAEEQSLRSRGEEYRQYQRTTSAFIPWLKKKD